uniref:Peroxiredoxin-like 2A n=1 Tax=Parastrongyloides trichosuri TaxID=131310 RepID=A0A0N4ZPT9_PARTI
MVWMFLSSIGVAIAGAIIYANLPTKLTIGSSIPTIGYLRLAKLRKIASSILDNDNVLIMAVRRPGCLLCRKEAQNLVSIKEELEKKSVKLVGVVHEYKGVDEFKKYFDNGDIYYDEGKRFYGPVERWMPIWMGFLRPKLWTTYNKAKSSGVEGNLEGEGRLLGGVYLVTKGKLIYSHLEEEWGDWANTTEILEELKKIN